MKDQFQDVGSASPPTADVPTEREKLVSLVLKEVDERLAALDITWFGGLPYVEREQVFAVVNETSRACIGFNWARVRRWFEPDHSGVAGEPEATTKGSCCPEFARNGYSHTEICPAFDTAAADPAVWVAERRAIESPTPTPDGPAAADVAGGVVVPDEAVEAAARADHAFGRLGDDPDWDGLTDTDRDSYRRAARSYVAAAAPLVVEHYLRSRIRSADVDHTPEEVWEQVREMARNAAVRTTVVDALRAAARDIHQGLAGICHPECPGCRVERRADELERDDEVTPMVGTVTADDISMICRATGSVGAVHAELVPEFEPEPCEACGAGEATGWPSMCADCRTAFNAWRARGGDR